MTSEPSGNPLDRALDGALRQALTAPDLPPGFRARLQMAMSRAVADESDRIGVAELRERLEREQHLRLTDLRENYLRLRRRTLAAVVGGAFAAGAAAALAMPWLAGHIGASAPLVMSAIGASMGLAVAFAGWLVRPGVPLRPIATRSSHD